jgi:protease-3
MKLVVSSKHSIKQLEIWVREKFTEIENKDVVLPDLSLPVAPYTKENLSQLIKFVPIESKNTMSVVWYLPDFHSKAYGSSPLSYFVHILNDRGEGSLQTHLKREGLILSMSAGAGEFLGDVYSHFTVAYVLTQKGLADFDQVLAATKKLLAHVQA